MIEVENLSLEGIKLIKTKKFYDDRGSFQQNYHIEMIIKKLVF